MSNQQNVHIDFDEIDEDIEKVEPSNESTTTAKAEPEQQTSSSLLSPELQELLKSNHEKTMNYIDHRFEKMNDKFKTHTEQIESNTSRIHKLEEQVAKQNEFLSKLTSNPKSSMNFKFEGEQQQTSNPNVIDATLGTVGGIAHGIVDTAAFLCESVIDLVTLGKARRER